MADKESGTSRKWTESECLQIASMDYFPSSVRTPSVQKTIITRFLNIYLGGKMPKGFSFADIVFAVLSITPSPPYGIYNLSFLWDDQEYRNDGTLFTLTPEAKNDALVTNNDQIMETGEHAAEVMDEDSKFFAPEINQEIMGKDQRAHFPMLITNTDQKANEEVDQYNVKNTRTYTEKVTVPIEKPMLHSTIKQMDVIENIIHDTKHFQQTNHLLNYGPIENAAFSKCCNDILEHRNDLIPELKLFFSIVSLVFLRATTKGYNHLFNTFHGNRFLLLFSKLNNIKNSYSPPHKRCIKRAYRIFRRKERNTQIMFAKILGLTVRPLNKYMIYVLRNGLLKYTADYGLNLVNLWRSIHNKVDNKLQSKQIAKATLNKVTEGSWKKLLAFMSHHLSSKSSNEFYRWARILDSGYFKDLSCAENYELAVILAVFAEKITGNTGVWQATWVQRDDLEDYKQVGRELYEQFVAEQ